MSDAQAALFNASLLIGLPVAVGLAAIILPWFVASSRWRGPLSAVGALLLLLWVIWFCSFITTPLCQSAGKTSQ